MAKCAASRSPATAVGMALVFGMLSGCGAPPPAPPVPEGAPPDFPSRMLRDLAGDAGLYELAPGRSQVHARVYRGGALARLGHDHVVSTGSAGGVVAIESRSSGARRVRGDFYVILGELTVDDPTLRAAMDFDSEPSDDDREGTRRNMLRSLDAAAFPWLRIEADATLPPGDSAARVVVADLRVTLAGAANEYRSELTVSVDNGSLHGRGELEIRQSDFGVQPFSVMGGALAVQDQVDISFDVVAVPVSVD